VQKGTTVKKTKRSQARITSGVVHVHSTFNNTIVTVSDTKGKVIGWSSAGTCGFKGSRKSTPFAASVAAKEACKKAKDLGVVEVKVFIKGPGPGKESAVRSVRSEGLNVTSIIDVTPTPHNGCRPRKKRRV
jgi:small subunit ribosomal protein S11